MATVLIATLPIPGHVAPLTPIARELVSRGHRVLWYTGAAFKRRIRELNSLLPDGRRIKRVPMSRPPDLSLGLPRVMDTGFWNVSYALKRLFVDWAVGQMNDLDAICTKHDVRCVVSDSVFMGSLLLKTKRPDLGLAVIGVTPLAVSWPFGLRCHPRSLATRLGLNPFLRLLVRWRLQKVRQYANRWRKKLGLPPSSTEFFDLFSETSDLFLQATVPEFEYPRRFTDGKVHFVGRLAPVAGQTFKPPLWWKEVEARVPGSPGRPIVHVTQGTASLEPHRLLVPAIRALANRDFLVVATTGRDEPLPLHPLPSNVRLAKFLPHDELLPHVDVMVTNAGYGGVSAALAAGVPLVTAGRSEDKGEVSARVAWARVGVELKFRAERPWEWQIRRSVKRVLEDASYRARSQAMKARFSAIGDGAANACNWIEGSLLRTSPVPAHAREFVHPV